MVATLDKIREAALHNGSPKKKIPDQQIIDLALILETQVYVYADRRREMESALQARLDKATAVAVKPSKPPMSDAATDTDLTPHWWSSSGDNVDTPLAWLGETPPPGAFRRQVDGGGEAAKTRSTQDD